MSFPYRWLRFGRLFFSASLVVLASFSPSFADYSVKPISLDAENPDRTAFGKLTWRGGLEITGDDRRFGGLSALQISADGKHLTAITDRGHWLRARLKYREGRLSSAENFKIAPMLDLEGRPLSGRRADAESLAKGKEGALFVSFERQHRIWRYAAAPDPTKAKPAAVSVPNDLRKLSNNGGLESLTRLCDDRLFAVAEKSITRRDTVAGWVQSGPKWHPLAYRVKSGLRPTGATTLPNCDVVFVERSFSIVAGLDIRLSKVPFSAIQAGAVLEPIVLANLSDPLTIDNFEGISSRTDSDGKTLLYIVSDDNFSAAQRTLLIMFALETDR